MDTLNFTLIYLAIGFVFQLCVAIVEDDYRMFRTAEGFIVVPLLWPFIVIIVTFLYFYDEWPRRKRRRNS